MPIQTFDSRSASIVKAAACLKAGASPAPVISRPFQRVTPLSVPTHTSLFPTQRSALIFRSGTPFLTGVTRPSER